VSLHRLAPHVWEPTAKDWWEVGRIILTVGDAHDWDRSKRRDFQNDALIALTARAHGATVVTANREDFELLGRKLGVRVPRGLITRTGPSMSQARHGSRVR
jgi:predicted nucleic acid-binding protein